MNALTLAKTRPAISRVLGVCNESAKVPIYVNEAQERLLNRADKPVGSLAKMRICAGTSGCLTWPRQVRTIEAFAVCSAPGVVRSEWFEFMGYPNGIGLQGEDSMPGTMLLDRGTACAFDDVIATVAAPRKICAIADNIADVGKKITLRYYDSNGNKVYTPQIVPPSTTAVVQEGERLTLISPIPAFPGNAVFTASNVMTGGLYSVIKDVTQYPIRLYETSAVPAIVKLLALYEPSEEVPIYRRSFIPGFQNMGACHGSEDEDCTENKLLTAYVKLQHVPVVVDNDPLVIGNLAALKLMVMAILREEQNRHDEAAVLEAKAAREIDGELSSYLGDGMVPALKVQGGDLFGAGSGAYGMVYW